MENAGRMIPGDLNLIPGNFGFILTVFNRFQEIPIELKDILSDFKC